MPELHGIDFLQYGALGLLTLVLYFVGKMARVFIDGTLANQNKLTGSIDALTGRLERLADAQEASERSIEELRKENTKEHEALIEGLRRLGGYRPSEKEFPAVRPDVKPLKRPGTRPDER